MNHAIPSRNFVKDHAHKWAIVYRCKWLLTLEEKEHFPRLVDVKQHDYVVYHAIMVEGKVVWRFYQQPKCEGVYATTEHKARKLAERLNVKPEPKVDGRTTRHQKKTRLEFEFIPPRLFMCLAANYVAQVYRCEEESTKEEAEADNPVAKFKLGDCCIYYQVFTDAGPVWRFYRQPKRKAVIPMTLEEAQAKAVELFYAADEEYQFGTIEGRNKHIVYDNGTHRVYYQPQRSFYTPFEIVRIDNNLFSHLKDKRGKVIQKRTLKDAIRLADSEDLSVQARTRRGYYSS